MKKLRLWTVTLLLLSFIFLPRGIASDVPFADVPFDVTDIPEPTPPPQAVRDFFQLDPYYQQWINVRGFPVLASAEVSPYSVKEAAWTIGHMVGHRPDILKVMAQNKARFSIVPHNKHLSDIPEYNFGRLAFFAEVRARGIGGWTTTSPEENIICGDSNYCYAELIHEFAHQLHDWVLNRIDSTFDSRLETMYNAALKEGLYQNRYAGSKSGEYWAEGVGSWFNGPNRDSNVALTRSALKKYDPRLAKLLTEVFGEHSWRYTPPATRTHLPHLQGFNPQEAPIYQRPTRLLELEAQLRAPTSDGGGKWVNLKLYDPSTLSHLKKLTTGRNRTDFLFGNLTGTDLALYFFNADGKKILYQYSTTTDFWHVITEVGAIWLIQDHTGKDLAVFRAEEEVGRVLITPTTVTVFITSGLLKFSGDNQGGVPGAILANPFVIEVRDESLSMLEGISVTFRVTAGDGTLSVTHTTTDENGRAESTLTLGPNLGTNAVSVSAAGIEHPVTFNAVAEAGVHIPNTNLRAAIETALGKAEGDLITPSEMATLIRLDAQNANISDLTGLEFATNLTDLNLGHVYVGGRPINSNSISNISPLAGLTYLTELRLGFNSIADISALAGLTNLTWLDLTGNSVSNIAPVASLTKLTQLDLDGNAISNISPVAGLTNLTFLDIWGTPISDISPVADLTKLTSLGLGHNNISDISPVAGLTNLTGLYLPSNHITDISSLSGLTNLKTLWLNQNSISDLSSLVVNTGLGDGDTVNVQGNPLSYQSIHTHIPILQSRGIIVEFDNRAPTPPVPFADVPFDVTNIPEPVPPPPIVRDFFQLDPYYQQWINVRGFPVLASAEVSPYSVKEAAWTIGHMVGHRPDILKVMAQNKARFSIVPHNNHLPDIPEYDFGRLEFFWEMRARGIGGLTTTSPEENIICGDSNYCYAELIHEFAHQLHGWGLNRIDSTFDSRLETMYNAALKEGLYQERYAGSNRSEYWAEGVGSWFNGPHRNNVAHTRLALKKYDPRLTKLLTEVFGDRSWRYTPPATRTHLPHIQGFNPQEAPIYQRPPELLELEEQLRDPNSDGGGKWVNLKLYDPSGLSHLKKLTTGGNSTDFLFGNLTGTDLALYSFNANGKKILYQYSTTTDFWHVITEVGAIWLIQDHTGKDLAVFRAEKKVGRVLVTPTPLLITPGLSKVSGDNQTGISGAVLANPFVIEVRDAGGSAFEGVPVTFTVTAGGGTLSVTSTKTDANGRAESTLTLGPAPGTNTVTVSVTGIQKGQTFNAEGTRVSKTLEIVSGDDQQGPPGAALEKPFVVEVRDQTDKPSPGVQVTFSVSSGGGTLNTTRATTNSNGRAESTLTLGPNPGTNSVTASVAGIQGTRTFTAKSIRIPKRMEIISGGDQEGLPVAALEKPFVVEVRDQTDKPLPDAQVTFSVSRGGGTLSATSVTTDSNGRAESTLTLGPNAGTNTVTASVAGIQETRTFTAESIRIPKRMELISGDDQEGLPGAALEKPFVVEVRDQTDRPLPGIEVVFSVTSGGGTLSATSVTTDSNGQAESTLTLGPNPGTNTVTVSVTGITQTGTFNAEGIRIPLAFWIISGDKQQGLLREALAKPFVVEVRDQSGEPLPGVQVTFSVSIGGGTLSVARATTDGKGRAESILTLGPNPGTNTVEVGVTRIQEKQSVSAIAELPPIPQDVNRDDVVNVLDLVLVASDLGDEGADLMADVNGDGVVNILDLVLVAGAFGDAAAAPSAQAPQTLTAADVQTWLTDARSLAGKDAMIKTGIVVLEQLLAALTPPETALLLNYPNPFNPETWIPYQLGEDANVTLTIYDTNGIMIRRLDLGHQSADYYTNRGKAAYWDGRNEGGESVASGLYFYQLATPSFRQLRRMVIVK